MRIEVAKSMVVVKPYFMDDQEVAIEITEMLSRQQQDTDPKVQETAEHSEFELFQTRKRSKEQSRAEADSDSVKVEFEKQLAAREKLEAAERKKRCEDHEEEKTIRYKYTHNNWKSSKGVLGKN